MSYEIPRIHSVSGRTIKIAHLDLPGHPVTYLLSDVAAAGVALTVVDNAGFANTNLLLIGELGSKATEIKKVNAAVTAGTSITSSAMTFAHPAGTPIRKILFNQFKIYGTNTTTFATDNLIATVDIAVDSPYTTYVNTGTEYSYYWVVAFDSINTVTGNNSDYVANATGPLPNSVGSLIETALQKAKKKKGGDITDDWFFDEIDECNTYIQGKLKRWSFLQSFDYILDQSVRGMNTFTLPTDIGEKNSIKSILGIRIGSSENLVYKDKREWEDLMKDVVLTTVRTQAAVGAVTLEIDNSYDLADSGSVNVYISGTLYTITYTGVTRSTTAGVLTGIPASGTGSITAIVPVDTNVWQGEREGNPQYFTVHDGSLLVYPLPDSSYDNQNAYLDYYTSRTSVNSAGDIVEVPRHDLVKHWLIWKLRCTNNASGELNMKDGDKVMFDTMLNDLVRREVSGQKFKKKPRVNGIRY